MRPRDLTKQNWDQHAHELSLNGLEVHIGWATGDISLTVCSNAGNGALVIPRRIFDKMVDWYNDTCTDTFWKTDKDGAGCFFGKKIPTNTSWGREWQLRANRLIYVEGKIPGKCDTARVDRSIMIRAEGLRDQVAVFFFRREVFDRIISWYNSEYNSERRAA